MKKRKAVRIAKVKRAGIKRKTKDMLSFAEIPYQSAKSIRITYSTVPVVSKKGKKIHARKRLPKLPVKKQVPDKNPSPSTNI